MADSMKYNAASYPHRTRRVYYEGSDELGEGYALCYNFNYGTAASYDADRAARVEQPATANLEFFAGVVHEDSAGVTGPAWVTIITDSECAKVYTDQDCSGSWGILLWPQNGAYGLGAESSDESAGATTDLIVNRGVAQTMQQVDRSGTDGTVQARVRSGAPFVETATA